MQTRREWDSAPRLRRFASAVVKGFFKSVTGLQVDGLDHVPAEGPLIVAGNHVSLADGPALAVALAPKRYLIGLGKAELYSIPLLGSFLRHTGTIPLDRRGDVHAMRAAIEVLAGGGCLGMFPEGTRSKDGKPGAPKSGIGFLAARSKAQVVPARLINTFGFPRAGKVLVRFGPAMRFEGQDDGRQACAAFARAVMDRVFSL